MQPVWHHLAWTQRLRSIACGTRSQVCPAAARRRCPQPARLRHLVPGRALHAQGLLGARVVGVERGAVDLARPHAPVGAVVRAVVAALERLAGRAQRRGQVEVRASANAVAEHDLGAEALDQPVQRAPAARCPSTAGSPCAGGAARARARGCWAPGRRRGRARPGGTPRSTRRSPSRRCRRRPSRQAPRRGALRREGSPVGEVGVAVGRDARVSHHLQPRGLVDRRVLLGWPSRGTPRTARPPPAPTPGRSGWRGRGRPRRPPPAWRRGGR